MRVVTQKAAINRNAQTLENALASLDGELSVDHLICISQRCRQRKDPKEAHQFLDFVRRHGLDAQKSLGTYLVPMLVDCGSIFIAQEVFDGLIYRNVHAWTSLISGYVQGGYFQRAWNLYRRMQESRVTVNSFTLITLLKTSHSLTQVQKTHFEVTEKGFEKDLYVGTALVNSYVKCSALSEAHGVFNQLSFHNVVSWTALIAGYTDNGLSQVALQGYAQMQKQGYFPNEVTLICILKACGNVRALVRGQEIHEKIVQEGYLNPLLGSTLVDMYAKCGAHSEAQALLRKQPVQDVVSWNALIAGYVEYELSEEALTCFEQMHDIKVSADAFTVVCVLKACGETGASDIGFNVHKEAIYKSYDSDPFVLNTLVDMYGKCGSLVEARKVFDCIDKKDLVSWNAMLRAYGANYDGNNTLQLFKSMQEQGVEVDSITFTSVLNACSHINCADQGLESFKMMTREYRITPTIDHFTCLIDLLARFGRLHEAEKVLQTTKGLQYKEMWLALLSACKSSSELDIGLRCFQQLVRMDPDCSTPYMLMASIYVSTGNLQDAHKIEGLQRDNLIAKRDLEHFRVETM